MRCVVLAGRNCLLRVRELRNREVGFLDGCWGSACCYFGEVDVKLPVLLRIQQKSFLHCHGAADSLDAEQMACIERNLQEVSMTMFVCHSWNEID